METDGSGTVACLAAVPVINSLRCSGCGRCVAACPLHLITLHVAGHRKTAIIRFQECCTRCRLCAKSCPIAAFD
jgi:NAD-dependent dihydropyrimidine dehydrogenase PreA subunit